MRSTRTTSKRRIPARPADSSFSWRLADLAKPSRGAPRVFSTFAGGGGSCMGYALAGYRVTGACEIDPEMAARYRANLGHRVFVESIQDFTRRDELPREARNLDVLDGSPPCSSFSMAGKREKTWGKERHFREGQAIQILDRLFFDFIELVAKAQPKVAVAENVKGMLGGNARGYVKSVFKGFRDAGYDVQLFLLNAADMGVPQRRERVFFLARRQDLNLPKIDLSFNESPIAAADAVAGAETRSAKSLSGERTIAMWHDVQPGQSFNFSSVSQNRRVQLGSDTASSFVQTKLHPRMVSPTINASIRQYHWSEPRWLSDGEVVRLQSFPDDYDFGNINANYVCGMSVPPRMMQRIATEIRRQWLDQRTETDAAQSATG